MLQLNERYVVDRNGERVAVLLDIADFQRLLDELASLRASRGAGRAPDTDSAADPLEQVLPGLSEHLPDSAITRHPPPADASVERLRDVLGSISLKVPVPSWRFLEDDNTDEGDRGSLAKVTAHLLVSGRWR